MYTILQTLSASYVSFPSNSLHYLKYGYTTLAKVTLALLTLT